MPFPSKVFVLDVDDTLINVEKIKSSLETNFNKNGIDKKLVWEIYDEVKKEKGFVDYEYLSEELTKKLDKSSQEIFNIFLHTDYKSSLFPKALDLIIYLQTLGTVRIVSQGHTQLQSQKIKNCGIEELVGKENIEITEQKKEEVKYIINELKSQGFSSITFVDDRAEILDEAFTIDKNITCYWIRNGKYKNLFPKTSCVAFQSDSLEEIYKFIYSNNIIGKIDVPTQEDLQIKVGLNPNQVTQLITFTHQDKDVQKFTSDLERFQNKESFYKWVNKGKYIYSLLDSRENLLGIIWFSEKTPPEDNLNTKIDPYKITLGIRIYGPARGKGLGRKLFTVALRHFKSTAEYKSIKDHGFWSVISEENIASQKLHESIGFHPVTKPNKEGKIVLIYD